MEVIDAHQHIGDLSNILGDGGSGGSSLGICKKSSRGGRPVLRPRASTGQ